MDIKAAQRQCEAYTCPLPEGHDRGSYYILGAAGEVGEAANIVKKVLRGDGPLDKQELALEFADVLIYLLCASNAYEIDLEGAFEQKIEINAKRFKRWVKT